MLKTTQTSRIGLLTLVGLLLLFPTLASSYHGGIAGSHTHQGSTGTVDIDDVAKSGCLCHNEVADNSVQVVVDHVPYAYEPGQTYDLRLQLIGGPPATGTYTAGFSMRVTLGELSSDMAQNPEIDGAVDLQALTHTEASSATSDRAWDFVWTAPADAGAGVAYFYIAGNSVNGDQVPVSKTVGISSISGSTRATKRPPPWAREPSSPVMAKCQRLNPNPTVLTCTTWVRNSVPIGSVCSGSVPSWASLHLPVCF